VRKNCCKYYEAIQIELGKGLSLPTIHKLASTSHHQ